MQTKHCNKCDQHKPIADFYPHKLEKYGVGGTCKVCTQARAKVRNRENPKPNNPPASEAKCSICHEVKPEKDFSPSPIKKNGLSSYCRACNNIKAKANMLTRPKELRQKVLRRHHLKKTFDLTLEQYQAMWDAQLGVCAICGKPETRQTYPTRATSSLSVDHNHETGMIRGLLCHSCNTALGLLYEDPVVIESMLDYVRKHA